MTHHAHIYGTGFGNISATIDDDSTCTSCSVDESSGSSSYF